MPWLSIRNDFDFVLIDSLSELADQKFVDKKGNWFFCSFFSDIDSKNKEFNTLFISEGLLDIGLIEKKYRDFFGWINKKYPSKQIIFIHYSTKLDERQKFKKRQQEISRVLRILSSENKNIKNIEIDDELVFYRENDKLPYHYSQLTNLHYAEQWKKVCGV